MSFYHTQDFAITVLFHHIETSGTKLFRNMLSVYSVIIIVLCLLCISDLYLTLPVCLDRKTSFKPQLPSVLNLSFYLSNTKDRWSPANLISTPSAAATYAPTVYTHTHTLTRNTHTHTKHTEIYDKDRQTVFRPTYQHTEPNSTLQQRILLSIFK